MPDLQATRRGLLVAAAASTTMSAAAEAQPAASPKPAAAPTIPIDLTINDRTVPVTVEPRSSLLDVLREQLALTGTKKAVIAVLAVPVRCMSTATQWSPA